MLSRTYCLDISIEVRITPSGVRSDDRECGGPSLAIEDQLAKLIVRMGAVTDEPLSCEIHQGKIDISIRRDADRDLAVQNAREGSDAGSLQTKKDQILELLGRPEGVTMSRMVEKTGWKASSVSAQLTYLKKLGYNIDRIVTKSGSRYTVSGRNDD